MEFHEKLQELRKQRGLTQEELAARLFVSRTAVSKWEAGRGYPNIESLKAIARVFSVTLDTLLSSEEILTVAEEHQKHAEKHMCDLCFGLLDLCMALLLFLPLFAQRAGDSIRAVSLLALADAPPYLKIAYFAVVASGILLGIFTLALQNCTALPWVKSKTKISLALAVATTLLFMVSGEVYAALLAFALLAIKASLLLRRM